VGNCGVVGCAKVVVVVVVVVVVCLDGVVVKHLGVSLVAITIVNT
jgi:hypothetical protein